MLCFIFHFFLFILFFLDFPCWFIFFYQGLHARLLPSFILHGPDLVIFRTSYRFHFNISDQFRTCEFDLYLLNFLHSFPVSFSLLCSNENESVLKNIKNLILFFFYFFFNFFNFFSLSLYFLSLLLLLLHIK